MFGFTTLFSALFVRLTPLKKEYVKELLREGYRTVKTYSLAFCEKRCRVIQGKTIQESVR